MSENHTLLVESPDETGLVYRITGVLFELGCNIVTNREYVDTEAQRFYMRTGFTGQIEPEQLLARLRLALPPAAKVRLAPTGRRRIVLLATKEPHCLGDLLIRNAFGEMACDVVAVVSNYDILRPLTESFGIDFHYIDHFELSRHDHETALLEVIERYEPEFLVLARYMRVLSPHFVERFRHRIVNIHHSFLPAFIGANPYRQAMQRGVKIIGATAHFVTDDLDEGPIIAQDVAPVSHHHTIEEIRRVGHDIEKIVLARALRLVLEDRLFVYGNRTVVFD